MESVDWDTRAFGFPCFELVNGLPETLMLATAPGHYTVKLSPTADKRALHQSGFYYCDTLIEPYCCPDMFRPVPDPEVTIVREYRLDDLLELSRGAYRHGRFHRDFNIQEIKADLRYDNWIRNLHASGNYFGLLYQKELAAYFGVCGNKVVLHAVSERFRGKGLAKYLWSTGYQSLFDQGFSEVTSSVSTPNLAVVNLYASIGFRFRNPVDAYHKFVPVPDLDQIDKNGLR